MIFMIELGVTVTVPANPHTHSSPIRWLLLLLQALSRDSANSVPPENLRGSPVMAEEGGQGHKDPDQNTFENGVRNGVNTNNSGDNEEAETQRVEITQTDHLNKRLLSSFLERLNQVAHDGGFPVVGRIDTSDPSDPEADVDLEYTTSAGEGVDDIVPDK